jgi:pyruvate/2-oxoglutarate dehydrogenase complex dihydrolipoamide acyltransferase (E2) component
VRVTLKLPRVSMNMDSATVTRWHKRPGEAFAEGEPLYEIETEKSTTDIEAPATGVLLEILANAGDVLMAGAEVCRLEIAQQPSVRREDR